MAEVSRYRGERLLYVVNEAYFFQTHRLHVARAAQQAGFDVHIAAPGDHVWAPKDFTLDLLRSEGFEIHQIPLSRRGLAPLAEVKTITSLYQLYKRLRPTLVHHLTVKPNVYGGLIARALKVPAMVSLITGLGQIFVERSLKAAALRAIVAAGYRSCGAHPNSQIVVQNQGDLQTLVDCGVDRRRIALVRGSGVDLEVFKPTPEPTDDRIVVFPARLIWEKGVNDFVAAAREIKKDMSDVRFVLVGDTQPSNPRSVPEIQLKEWIAENTIEWWGRRGNMPEVYAASSIVCLPSAYGEGVPKVLIEGAASQRALVTSDIAGCREIVKDGVNGLLVPVGNPGALAAALRSLLSQPGLRQQMGHRGREIAEVDFSVEKIVGQNLSIYASLMSSI